MSLGAIRCRVVLTNLKALRALRASAEAIEELADLSAWRPEVKRATKALRYVAKHLTIVAEEKK